MKKLACTLFIFIVSCVNKDDNGLQLEILNNSIVAVSGLKGEISENFNDSNFINKSKTIIVYKLSNNSNYTYYFNLNSDSKFSTNENSISLKNASIKFYEKGSNEPVKVNYHRINSNFNSNDCYNKATNISRMLNYSADLNSRLINSESNFTIHPHETLYFEWFINLPYGNEIQRAHLNLMDTKKYYCELNIYSDTTNYKNLISRTDLKRIKDNGYVVFHGKIKSKNRVPIEFIKK